MSGACSCKDRELAARRIIFGKLGDLLEQLRAGLVVEIFRREPLRARRQAGEHVARELRFASDGRAAAMRA